MRTVGDILKETRLKKKLTFDDVEKKLRIRKKFLVALEENDWIKLPSLPYIKGFLRNYSLYLGLKPDEMIAIFRRQYQYHDNAVLLPEGVIAKNEPFIRFTPQRVLILITGLSIILLFTYLFFQLRSFINPPNLIITVPQEGEIITSDIVEVSGKTDIDAVVEINNQKIALNNDGKFATTLTLNPGVNTITIKSVGKNGKVRTVIRTISIQAGNQ